MTVRRSLLVLASVLAVVFAVPAFANADTTVSTLPGVSSTTGTGSSGQFQLGQVVLVPAGEGQLSSFTFNIGGVTGTYTIQVYAWSGTAATGSALYTSTSMSAAGNVTVTPNVVVTAGASYVVFLANDGLALGSYSFHDPSGSYAGGNLVAHFGAPTAGSWINTGSPSAFSATFTAAAILSTGSRGGYCTSAPVVRADGSTGVFLDLDGGQNVSDPRYAGATTAWYGQGYGLTCDNLPGLGYKDAGYRVDDTGIHTGTAADIYEYFTR